MRDSLLILLLFVLVTMACKKQQAAPNDPKFVYATKYAHLMAGQRHWHRFEDSWQFTYPEDSIVLFTDTSLAVSVINDTTIAFPCLHYISIFYLIQADSNMLAYSNSCKCLSIASHFPDVYISAYFFPKKDCVSVVEDINGHFGSIYHFDSY